MRKAFADVVSAAVGAAVFGVAWFAGLWLFVIAMATVAAVAVVLERRRQRAVQLHSLHQAAGVVPKDGPPAERPERALDAALVVASGGSMVVLARARAIAEQIQDPWRRALALERLDRVGGFLEPVRIRGLSAIGREASLGRFAAAGAALGAGVSVGQLSGNRAALLLVFAGGLELTLALIDWTAKRSALPSRVVAIARLDPAQFETILVREPTQERAGGTTVLRPRLVRWWMAMSATVAVAAEIVP